MGRNDKHQIGTKQRILDVAEQLLKQRGFNGFSYADIAAEVGITTASLHYHFASKSELGKALVERYTQRFSNELARISDRSPDAWTRLDAYAELYAGALKNDGFCLCGMLAAEYRTLPQIMQTAVIEFFDLNEAWVSKVLSEGQKEGSIEFSGPPSVSARMVVSALEGALLVARPYGEVDRFRTTVEQLLRNFVINANR